MTLLAHASAEIGVFLIALVIVEGSIWGKPTWGVWWTWDARLTTTAILLLIFVGYLLLRSLIEDEVARCLGGSDARNYRHSRHPAYSYVRLLVAYTPSTAVYFSAR